MAKKFLLIDDDKDDCDLLQRAFEKTGADIVIEFEHNGLDGLNRLVSDPLVDLVFLDLNMQVMNGMDCLAAIKRNASLEKIPVIVYTTSDFPPEREQALSLGALCFVTKHVDFTKTKRMARIVVDYMNENRMSELCEAIHAQ